MTGEHLSHLIIVAFQSLNVAKRKFMSSQSLNVMVGHNIIWLLDLAFCCVLCCFCCDSYRSLVFAFVTKVCKEKKKSVEECAATSFLLFSLIIVTRFI